MSLPTWIEAISSEWIPDAGPVTASEMDLAKVIHAFKIAWEALEKIRDVSTEIDKTLRAKEALRRIEELSK